MSALISHRLEHGIGHRIVRRSAFTMVELLTVIGIIVVLMGLLLPSAGRAYRQAVRTRMARDLQTISAALEAYHTDMHQYPTVDKAGNGANVLCTALMGTGRTGFRLRSGGKVYGPYLPPDQFKVYTAGSGSNAVFELHDSADQAILYFPGNKHADIRAQNGYMATGAYGSASGNHPYFNASDNGTTDTLGVPRVSARNISQAQLTKIFQWLLGDTNNNGYIDGTEAPAFTGDYLLLSAGPDGVFGGIQSATLPFSSSNPCDDVANFSRSEY